MGQAIYICNWLFEFALVNNQQVLPSDDNILNSHPNQIRSAQMQLTKKTKKLRNGPISLHTNPCVCALWPFLCVKKFTPNQLVKKTKKSQMGPISLHTKFEPNPCMHVCYGCFCVFLCAWTHKRVKKSPQINWSKN